MVRQFHDGMLARGQYAEQISVTTGGKQGCVLPAVTLFSIMFSAMLTNAFLYYDDDFPIRYCFDGKLFNLRMLQAKSKVQTGVQDELLYADDIAKNI